MCKRILSMLSRISFHFFFSFNILVGKLRKPWLKKTVGEVGLGSMRAIKNYIDPDNIFGNNNLMIGDSKL